MSVLDFQKMKQTKQKISMVTCYDYWSAKIIEQSDIDCILVGDSGAMVMHGYPTTVQATVALMTTHIHAVVKGAGNKFIIGDMPFLSYRTSLSKTMQAVREIMQAGAHAIKLEGAEGNLETIKHIVNSGVPVMGHLGLTPQAVHQLGGFRVQGKQQDAAEKILQDALAMERAGCFAVVLECIPAKLAGQITQQLTIPTIGIGAGCETDGQVLVLQDLLGMSDEFKPKFLKRYMHGCELIKNALNTYNEEVKKQLFPDDNHSY